MNNVETIKPFRNFCMTIGALPTSYLESMSYYEMLAWLCKYLENTINPAINNNAEALKELQSYVANYFDNLDVQEEINTKLDEMADDGTLAEIINVEMIGSLSDLNTTDKTDIVSAINEVDSNIKNINLTTYTTYDTFTSTSGIVTGHITTATNSDGSLCKVYGVLYCTGMNENELNTINLASGTILQPSTGFNVEGTTIIQESDKTIRFALLGFNTNGNLTLNFNTIGAYATIYLLANLIYVKDFGDSSPE